MTRPHPIAAPAAHKAHLGAFLPELAPTYRASVGAVFSGRAHGSALPVQPAGKAVFRLPALAAGSRRQGAEMLWQFGRSGVNAQAAGQNRSVDRRDHVLIVGRVGVSGVPHVDALQGVATLRQSVAPVALQLETIAQ